MKACKQLEDSNAVRQHSRVGNPNWQPLSRNLDDDLPAYFFAAPQNDVAEKMIVLLLLL